MDQTYLLLLAASVIVALAALGVIRSRPQTPSTPEGTDSPFAASTEGDNGPADVIADFSSHEPRA